MRRSILLVEDDANLGHGLKEAMSQSGYAVTWALTVADARRSLASGLPDLVISDVGLPDGDGITLCREISERSMRPLPVIVISARSDEATAVRALSQGATDFIRKPCSLGELLLKTRRLLGEVGNVRFGGLTVNLERKEVWLEGKRISLRRREFDIFSIFMRRPNEIVTREQLLNELNEALDTSDRTVDSHVSRIRRALRTAGANHVLISPVYGMGYKLQLI